MNMFKYSYIDPSRPDKPKVDFTASIRLDPNHDNFFYRLRRLPYHDKQMVNDMRGFVRPWYREEEFLTILFSDRVGQ